MTIFDVLTYSISDPPTEEELDKLPSILMTRYKVVIWGNYYCTNRQVANALRVGFKIEAHKPAYDRRIAYLRKLIRDYNDDI